jgi:hypothetical protein
MAIRPGQVSGRHPVGAGVTMAVALVALAGGLVGCSSGGSAHPAAAGGLAAPGIPTYDPAKGARPDATVGQCGADKAGGWALTGTVKNSSASSRTYAIVVDFVTAKGNTVVDTQRVNVAGVASGASHDWVAQGASGKGDDTLRCVIRSVQHN